MIKYHIKLIINTLDVLIFPNLLVKATFHPQKKSKGLDPVRVLDKVAIYVRRTCFRSCTKKFMEVYFVLMWRWIYILLICHSYVVWLVLNVQNLFFCNERYSNNVHWLVLWGEEEFWSVAQLVFHVHPAECWRLIKEGKRQEKSF